MMQALIEIQNLSHRFPDGTAALNGINLKIAKGSFTVIGGENGSGKTVLMKHLNGLLIPTEGRILVNGIDVAQDSWNARKTIGFVFQNADTQIIAQTVRDDIAFGPENTGLKGAELEEKVKQSAESLNITHLLDHSPHRLSGGEKKKTAIAGIIAMSPDAVVFDEPFAGLDYRGVQVLLEIMTGLHSAGTTIILITHDLEKVLAHADSLAVMSRGEIKAHGNPQDFLDTAAEYGLRVPSGKKISEMSWLL